MSLILFRIGFFALVPLGIFLLLKALKFSKSVFYGEVRLELPFATKSAPFTITEAGVYAIWQKGKAFARTPLDAFRPVVYHDSTNEVVPLSPSFFRASMTNGDLARQELATFSAGPGAYRLELQAGSGLGGLEKALSALLPGKPADTSQYAVQIRRSQPFYYKLAVVPLFIAVGWLIIGGLVAGLLADQLAPVFFP